LTRTPAMFVDTISFPAAFIAGLLSFFSPCILPLVPAYFTFITGFSLEELTGGDPRRTRQKVVMSTIFYVLGFSLVFILMGASASLLGGLFSQSKDVIRIVGGVIILLLGLHISGLVRLPFLDVEKRFHFDRKPLHALGTFLVGMAFGAGWSPCIGPLLGGILIMAGSQATITRGVLLLAVYSAGLAIPFLVISVFISSILSFLRRASKALKYVNAAAGALLVVIGALLIANKLNLFI